jgi:hypothetical protein
MRGNEPKQTDPRSAQSFNEAKTHQYKIKTKKKEKS